MNRWTPGNGLLLAALLYPPAALAQPAAPAPAPPPTLAATGFAEADRIDSGETAAVWIMFENRTGGAVSGLRFVDFRKPGLNQGDRCWRDGAPACVADSAAPRTRVAALPELPAGGALTLTARVKGKGPPGSYRATGIYAWRDAAGGEHRGVVSVGPIQVVRWADWRSLLKEDWASFFKDVLFPILALFLGAWFTKVAGRQGALQQTWTQMLSKSHENAERHYMPISSAAGGLSEALKDAKPEEAFYYLALFLRRMWKLREEIGGFYFKDRMGERVARGCWVLFVDRFEDVVTIERKDRLIAAIAEDDSYDAFQRKRAAHPGWFQPTNALPDLFAEFERWRGRADLDLDRAILKAFETMMDFETNRPYELWYRRRETLDVEELAEQEGGIAAWLAARRGAALPPVSAAQPFRGSADERERVEKLHALLRAYRRKNVQRNAPRGTRWIVFGLAKLGRVLKGG